MRLKLMLIGLVFLVGCAGTRSNQVPSNESYRDLTLIPQKNEPIISNEKLTMFKLWLENGLIENQFPQNQKPYIFGVDVYPDDHPLGKMSVYFHKSPRQNGVHEESNPRNNLFRFMNWLLRQEEIIEIWYLDFPVDWFNMKPVPKSTTFFITQRIEPGLFKDYRLNFRYNPKAGWVLEDLQPVP